MTEIKFKTTELIEFKQSTNKITLLAETVVRFGLNRNKGKIRA
jgi:hypothetical protein